MNKLNFQNVEEINKIRVELSRAGFQDEIIDYYIREMELYEVKLQEHNYEIRGIYNRDLMSELRRKQNKINQLIKKEV